MTIFYRKFQPYVYFYLNSLFFFCIDEPILTFPQAFRSSSIVLSCNWSTCRASVFFAHDSHGHIKYWDLTKDQYEPIGHVKIEK